MFQIDIFKKNSYSPATSCFKHISNAWPVLSKVTIRVDGMSVRLFNKSGEEGL